MYNFDISGIPLLKSIREIFHSRAKLWTILAFLFAFLVVIFDTIKLVRVFSLKLLRGIPREFTFELNLILSTSYFFHLIGFVYALGLPDKDREKKSTETKGDEKKSTEAKSDDKTDRKNDEDAFCLPDKDRKKKSTETKSDDKTDRKNELYDRKVNKILSLSAGIFIVLTLVFHITSTALLIDYSPPNYILI